MRVRDDGALVIHITHPGYRVANRISASGQLRPVTVTDTRTSTNPGWDASVLVSDFITAYESSSFGGGYLGWSLSVASMSEGQSVTPLTR